jgi:hypothetical protein
VGLIPVWYGRLLMPARIGTGPRLCRLDRTKFFDEDVAGLAGILCERLARFAIDWLIQHFQEARRAPAAVTLRMLGAGQFEDVPIGLSGCLCTKHRHESLHCKNQKPSDPGRAAGR